MVWNLGYQTASSNLMVIPLINPHLPRIGEIKFYLVSIVKVERASAILAFKSNEKNGKQLKAVRNVKLQTPSANS